MFFRGYLSKSPRRKVTYVRLVAYGQTRFFRTWAPNRLLVFGSTSLSFAHGRTFMDECVTVENMGEAASYKPDYLHCFRCSNCPFPPPWLGNQGTYSLPGEQQTCPLFGLVNLSVTIGCLGQASTLARAKGLPKRRRQSGGGQWS